MALSINDTQYSQHFIFFITYESAQQARVLHKTMLERLAISKLAYLLDLFVSYDENALLWIRSQFIIQIMASVSFSNFLNLSKTRSISFPQSYFLIYFFSFLPKMLLCFAFNELVLNWTKVCQLHWKTQLPKYLTEYE
jgi:hypothetical protein